MKTILKAIHANTLPFTLCFLLFGAMSTMQSCSKFDKVGMDNATSLATSLSDLIGKATGKYSANTDAINKVTAALDSAVKHAASVKNNVEISEAWKTLQNEIVTPFLARWKEKGMLDKEVVKETKSQVAKSLDAIKKAEMARKKK